MIEESGTTEKLGTDHPLKIKFPEASYVPDPHCKKCNGLGYIHLPERVIVGSLISQAHDSPCICIFVDHSVSEEFGDMIRKVTSDILKEMEDTDKDDTVGQLLIGSLRGFQ